MMGFLASIKRLLRGNDKGYAIAEVYRGLRQQVLTLEPDKFGMEAKPTNNVWGILMETGYPEAVATLVTLADRTVSIYFSNGGGMIGFGKDETRRVSEAFLDMAPKYVTYASHTDVFPLPSKGYTRFYFLTFDGIFTVEKKENDLGNWRSPLSPFFHKGHEVITEVRLIDEKLRAQKKLPPAIDRQ
jgi:hypothetical protein